MLHHTRLVLLSAAMSLTLAGPLQAAAPAQQQDSVHSWGRWEVLAPAAGGVPTASALPVEAGVELRPGEAANLTPQFQAVNTPQERPEAKPPVTDIDPEIPLQNDQPTRRPLPFELLN